MTTAYDVKILSTGAYVPGEPLDNATLEKFVGPLPDDVLEGIQVKTRYWMIDPVTGEHRINNSRMAERASRQALERAGVEPGELDLIVVCTATPEYTLPNVATTLQHYLGLESVAAVEIRGACAGWVQALDLARRQLADGTARTALVVGSEAGSPVLAPHFLGKDPARVRMRDRLMLYTFGDGAGAVVMRAEPAGGGSGGAGDAGGGFAFVNACVGGLRKPGMEIIGGGTDVPQAEQLRRRQLIQMKIDVPGTSTFGPQVFVRAIREMARKDGRALGEFDAIVLPEGNAEYFADEFASAGLSQEDIETLDGRIVENLAEVGATGSAAVPLSLDAGWTSGRIGPGDRIVLLGIEASRYVYTGLSLTWQAPLPA
ncbi:3-oxoacyl-[acyl-carrier-protein] synthase III C-terminal domain-containing protein [Streptomyces sp. JB150]|uniref:3-oxoacyl-ACP synthase III family protein n=1 Tax=Streptomyces sp. JB150 TaxID=2714844 RepID=UPI0019D0386F|nr:3-oxoacyl-[acyl-carrier-protein] synthase III C-terminal domain-containing protein [Streptomyces sp. JB150]